MLQQMKNEELRYVAAYWLDWIINLKTIHDLHTAQQWINDMEATMQKAHQATRSLARGSIPSLLKLVLVTPTMVEP